MFNVFGMIEANHTVLLLVEIYLYCIVLYWYYVLLLRKQRVQYR